MRSYLILATRKCRIYAACGVLQTPIIDLDYEVIPELIEYHKEILKVAKKIKQKIFES